jgi:hypothetical protein
LTLTIICDPVFVRCEPFAKPEQIRPFFFVDAAIGDDRLHLGNDFIERMAAGEFQMPPEPGDKPGDFQIIDGVICNEDLVRCPLVHASLCRGGRGR